MLGRRTVIQYCVRINKPFACIRTTAANDKKNRKPNRRSSKHLCSIVEVIGGRFVQDGVIYRENIAY
jgi:hypothetical protein